MSDVVSREEVDALFDRAQTSHNTWASLETLLARPMRLCGADDPVTPDQDVVRHVLTRGPTPLDLSGLNVLASTLSWKLAMRLSNSDDEERAAGAARTLSRLGFLSVALDLRHGTHAYEVAAEAIRGRSLTGPEVDRDLFGILRTASHLGRETAGTSDGTSFWRGWLVHPRKGIRTVAAQTLVRAATFEDLPALMAEVSAADVHLGLTCSEWSRRPDVAEDLSWAARVLEDDVRRSVARGLREVGQVAAADVVSCGLGSTDVVSGGGPQGGTHQPGLARGGVAHVDEPGPREQP